MSEDRTGVTPDAETAREARYRLAEALDGELPRETVDRMLDHAAGCVECHDEIERLRRLKELVRRSCVDRAPSTLRERIAVQCRTVSVTSRADGTAASVRITTTRREITGP
ncbi:zf-HC2 domain-containing protein [Brachybacterium sp. J153]|uniref:zf-HC2 domain-containing protein n=1 Tax=Brachybacterium sp. J153 TaxID=3116488 RepID=UPI002E762B88|nr:zf-HC2 domain-containing protein [Brachybacterium sp. J153]MEE1617063.1 zf-HC2 domain-containing protein [Brachybacterium sp. J153]